MMKIGFMKGITRWQCALLTLVMIGTASLVAACRPDTSAGQMEAVLDSIAEGDARLQLSGAVTSATDGGAARDAGVPENRFAPAGGGRSKHSRRGTNAAGPYRIVIQTEAIHQEEPDTVVRAWITLVLPKEAGPGTYDVAAATAATDDQVQAALTGEDQAWQFAGAIEGQLHIAEIGDQLTAAWEFSAQDRAGEVVEISGGVKGLEFTPQEEANYILTVNGDATERVGRMSSHHTKGREITLIPGAGIYIEMPLDIGEGTHIVRKQRVDESDVVLNLPNYSFDIVEGEISLKDEGGHFSGSFDITASGKDDISFAGSFDHVPLDARRVK